MRIKKLILKGFKSFPNKTEIVFSPKITACVGPNGCGKTNIFEGILFALGEKKPQNLRGNTWEDLIFSGNEKISRLLSAEVAIIMEREEEEIEIRRKIYRDGKIENYINGEYISHLKWNDKIYEIFPQGNSYALMKNEDIEKFIMDAPRYLKEFIHSMAGLELFEKKKDTLKRRLLRVEREIERLEDILNLKEKRLDELQKEVFRLKNYWNIKERINALEKEKISINYFYLKREIQKRERERENFLKEMEIYREKEKDYEKVLMDIKKEVSTIDEKIKELEEKEKELIKREKEITVEKVRIFERKDNLLLNKNEIEKRRENLSEILKEIEKESISLKETQFNEEEFKKKGEILKESEEELEKIEREKEEIQVKKINFEENIKVLKNRIFENNENILKE
ncbi:MAG: AAA family ATPase [candidate division WOR-3 bacterium]